MAVDVKKMREYYLQVKEYLDTLIVGEEKAKDTIVSSLLCDKNSRILLTGMPGAAKSTISNGLAKNFISKKISITSDLLPSDILNAIMKEQNLQMLQLEELNRASGKVQSSLIELLADNKITTDTQDVNFKDFYVIATQNDSEIAGVFDVPYAIYDRFDVNVSFGDLTLEELEQVIFEFEAKSHEANFDLHQIIDVTTKEVENFIYSKEDKEIIMEVVKILKDASYNSKKLFASTNVRGYIFMRKIAAFHALANGREWLNPGDISDYISNIYLHRINQGALQMNDVEASEAMEKIEKKVLSLQKEAENNGALAWIRKK